MFTITSNQSIYLTRGDIATIQVSASTSENEDYIFKNGDVVRFKVFEAGKCDVLVMMKDVTVESEVNAIDINLSGNETKIGNVINKPTDYWYEIELNPKTSPQTIIGYDEKGPKIFRLFPEGG